MIRYKLVGKPILDRIAELDGPLRAQVYDDLQELEVDPENNGGDTRSSIMEFKDPAYGHTYSILVGGGRLLIIYTVRQDYPRVWLRTMVDSETGEALGE